MTNPSGSPCARTRARRPGCSDRERRLHMRHTADVPQRHEARRVEHGKVGEVVAYVPQDEGTRSLRVLGELLIYKIPSHRTGGAYSLFEATTYPGLGPPPHVHHREG